MAAVQQITEKLIRAKFDFRKKNQEREDREVTFDLVVAF